MRFLRGILFGYALFIGGARGLPLPALSIQLLVFWKLTKGKASVKDEAHHHP